MIEDDANNSLAFIPLRTLCNLKILISISLCNLCCLVPIIDLYFKDKNAQFEGYVICTGKFETVQK